jgi:AraC-like DNA-binding protein
MLGDLELIGGLGRQGRTTIHGLFDAENSYCENEQIFGRFPPGFYRKTAPLFDFFDHSYYRIPMLLLYRIQGERRYGLNAFPPHRRKAWAFQVILSGQCSLLVQKDNVTHEERVTGPVLSIAGPDCPHVWRGKPDDVCKVMCFHFDQADPILCSVIGQDGYRYVSISDGDIQALQALYDRCGEVRGKAGFMSARVHASYKTNVNLGAAKGSIAPAASLETSRKAGFLAPLIYGIVSRELTLLFLKHVPRAELGPAPDFCENKVAEAMAWYEVNLANGPSIQDVASAIHISPTHLRRLFHKVRGMSPQAAFTHLQFERAKWLMRDLSLPLERVAENSGFGSASALSRTFKKEFGISPKKFRTKLRKS